MQILDKFMTTGDRDHWVTYLIPENPISDNHSMVAYYKDSDETSLVPDVSELDQLLLEARAVLTR